MKRQLNVIIFVFAIIPTLVCALPLQQAYKTKVHRLQSGVLEAMDGSTYIIPHAKSIMRFMDELVIYQVREDWHVCHDGNNYLTKQIRATLDHNYRNDIKINIFDVERLKECY